MSTLLNRKAVREFALNVAEARRGAANFQRVGASFLAAIEAAVRESVLERVVNHPTNGRTLR
jgi:hypothetical protein